MSTPEEKLKEQPGVEIYAELFRDSPELQRKAREWKTFRDQTTHGDTEMRWYSLVDPFMWKLMGKEKKDPTSALHTLAAETQEVYTTKRWALIKAMAEQIYTTYYDILPDSCKNQEDTIGMIALALLLPIYIDDQSKHLPSESISQIAITSLFPSTQVKLMTGDDEPSFEANRSKAHEIFQIAESLGLLKGLDISTHADQEAFIASTDIARTIYNERSTEIDALLPADVERRDWLMWATSGGSEWENLKNEFFRRFEAARREAEANTELHGEQAKQGPYFKADTTSIPKVTDQLLKSLL